MSANDVEKLASKILYHKKKYYNGEPEITDASYDQLEEKLRQLNPDHPVLYLVGTPDGGKVPHDPPMLSSQKATELSQVVKWANDIEMRPLTAGYKVDGLSLSIVYQNGKLSQAATRGNGNAGDDATHECMLIDDIPKTVPITDYVNVRGEVYMRISEFEKVNKSLPKEDRYSAPRNLAAGTLKQKTLDILETRQLNFMAWQLLGYGSDLTNERQMELLKSWGFDVADRDTLESPSSEIINQTFQKYVKERDDLDFEIDGVIFKYNLSADRENAGVTEHHPKWSIAWKFQSKGEITIINDITWQVGRTGVLTPVAEVEPVNVAGATIRRVTLHNAEMIETLNIAIGDTISLIRSGDVIPKIVDVVDKGENDPTFPKTCPSCGSDTKRDGVDLICIGDECRDRDIQRIIYWIRQVDIKGLGDKSVEKLYDEGLVHHYADLYHERLSETKLVQLLGKNGEKIFKEIEKSREMPFSTFLGALGIRNLGPKMGKNLAEKFETFDDLKNASIEELLQIDGVSDLTASYIIDGVNDPNTGDKVLEHHITLLKPKLRKSRKSNANTSALDTWFSESDESSANEPIDDIFDPKFVDMKIYITGSIEGFSKKDLQDELEERGLIWHKSVSSNLDYLIYGENAGQKKLDDAAKKGVKTLSWSEFNSSLEKPLKKE